METKFVFPLENIDNFFRSDENKNKLVSLDFSNFDSSKITSVQNCFTGLTSLKYVDLSNFGSSKITPVQNLFTGLTSLKYVDLSNFVSSLTSIAGLFKGLSSLKSVKLPNFPNSKITSMESMFEDCTSLESFEFIWNRYYIFNKYEEFIFGMLFLKSYWFQ